VLFTFVPNSARRFITGTKFHKVVTDLQPRHNRLAMSTTTGRRVYFNVAHHVVDPWDPWYLSRLGAEFETVPHSRSGGLGMTFRPACLDTAAYVSAPGKIDRSGSGNVGVIMVIFLPVKEKPKVSQQNKDRDVQWTVNVSMRCCCMRIRSTRKLQMTFGKAEQYQIFGKRHFLLLFSL
jgi:hypothetical protein